MFGSLSEKFENALRKLSGQSKISESNVREAMEQVREALLEADVHYEVAESFCSNVQQQALGTEVLQSVEPGQQMIKIVNDELIRLLGGDDALAAYQENPGQAATTGEPPILYVSPGPTIIMMCGLQGSGKTTTCGKLAAYLKKRGKSICLAAADLQRPAAVHQLQVLAEQVRDQVEGSGAIHFYAEPERCAEYGRAVGVAVEVCRNAVREAQARNCDVLILDTAGRLHINDDLMGELKQVAAATQPHHIALVIDAMTGQDAVNSAKTFNDQLELDGVILTKFDSDTRGGAALSVKQVTGKPIRFIGVGEKLDALEEFHPARIAGRILGMGDVVSLVEKAQEQVSEEEALALQEKMAQGKLTMEDFLGQLKKIRKMGSMKSLLGLLPGIGNQLKNLDLDDREINRTEAIIQSMTLEERRHADLLNNSRRRRIARGSGTDAMDVSKLVKGFEMISTVSKQMSNMGMLQRMQAMAGMSNNPGALLGGGMPKMKGSTAKESKFKQRKRKKR